MSRQARICGVQLGSVGVLAIILYMIDKSIAARRIPRQALDAYAPGEDYPIYTEVPEGLSFTCEDKIPGYYADPETMCQVWHWCVPGIGGNIKYSFLCGPGTVFNQRLRVCDWFFKTDCPNSASYYGVNEDLYKDEQGNFITGKKGNTYNDDFDERRLTARRKRQHVAKTVPKVDVTTEAKVDVTTDSVILADDDSETNKHRKRHVYKKIFRYRNYHEINRAKKGKSIETKTESNSATDVTTTMKSTDW